MLDKSKIGFEFQSFTADVEKGRLRFFAKAIGETNPIYTDEAAAREAGYRALVAPPTFTMVLEFVVLAQTYTNQDGELVAKSTNTLVHRNG
jgi:acyl dehydratase